MNKEGFRAYLLSKGYSDGSIKRYVRDALRFLGWLKAEQIEEDQVSYADVLHYIQIKKGNIKQSSIRAFLTSIERYYDYLKKEGLIEENPTIKVQIKGVQRKHLYHILSPIELDQLYANYGKGQESLVLNRNKVIVGLIVYQGLGTLEMSRLALLDLSLREGKVHVRGSRKSNDRLLKLESHQMMDLMEYELKVRPGLLKVRGKSSDQFLLSSGGSDQLHNMLGGLVKQLRKQNPRVSSIRQLRTSVITHWLKRYNLREVQYMAGHRFVSSTEGYLVNDLDDLQDDIEKYHPGV